MKPIFNELIQPMMQTFAVDLIAEILMSERDNQIKIAKELGKSEEWINNFIYFDIKNHQLRAANTDKMPCVYIYLDRTDYGNSQTMSKLPSTNQLVMELFTKGVNELIDENSVDVSADEIADIRLDYLIAQVKQIMMSEEAENVRCKAGIRSTVIKSHERVFAPERENIAQSVFSQKLVFELEFDEKTKYLSGTRINELYIENHIRDELIKIHLKDLS